jgi:excisionase family DNA binding protein
MALSTGSKSQGRELETQVKEQEAVKLLFSIEEAASALSVSPWTLRSHAKRGTLPTVKIGTRRLVRAADLDRIAADGLESLT